MSVATEWQAGERCEKHDMMFCADCLEQAGLRRDRTGAVLGRNDCAVQTYAEITGEGYEIAIEVLRAAGYRPSNGTPMDGIRMVFEAAGFKVREVTGVHRVESLPGLSADGRAFYVVGWKGRGCHAWSVTGGQARRAYATPFRYRAFEVVA